MLKSVGLANIHLMRITTLYQMSDCALTVEFSRPAAKIQLDFFPQV